VRQAIGARFEIRTPPEYVAALKAFALLDCVPLAKCVRGMAHDEILKRGASFRERGIAFRALSNAAKAWLMSYHACVGIVGQLSGKERRAELEKPTWNAVKRAHEFIETEEAAKNAKHLSAGRAGLSNSFY
jgi:hypothetical protein